MVIASKWVVLSSFDPCCQLQYLFLLAHLTLLSQEEEVLLESRRSSHSEASSSAQPAAADEPQTGLLALEAALEHVVEAGIDAGMDILDAGKHIPTHLCQRVTHQLAHSLLSHSVLTQYSLSAHFRSFFLVV